MNPDRLRKQLTNLAIHAILIAGALFMLFPFVWMVLGSLKTYNDATTAGFLPREWLWSNYPDAITTMNGSVPCQFDPTHPLAILDQCLLASRLRVEPAAGSSAPPSRPAGT